MNKFFLFLIPLFIKDSKPHYFDDYFNSFFGNLAEEKNISRKDAATIEDDNFPGNTEIIPCKVDVNKAEDNQIIITLQLQGALTQKDIRTEKNVRYVKIEIHIESQSYVFVLEENKLFLASSCQQVMRNAKNTKYSSSSSSMSRQEILPNAIDLNSVKMNIKKDSGVVTISAQYKDPKQNKQDIEIEFE